MAEKDAAEKILMSYNDVFADIVNALLFDGEPVVAPEELEDQTLPAAATLWSTLVLYFGHKTHWNKPLSLKERLDIPPKLEPFVSDYKINLFEIAYLTHEQVKLFHSDFRIVADYFVQKQEKGETGEYTPDPHQIRHVQETLQLLSVMTRDHRFEDAYNEICAENGMEGGPYTMCEFLDKIENRGIEKGLLKGERTGELNAKREIAQALAGMGMPVEKIAEAVKTNVETVRQWLASGGSAL